MSAIPAGQDMWDGWDMVPETHVPPCFESDLLWDWYWALCGEAATQALLDSTAQALSDARDRLAHSEADGWHVRHPDQEGR